MVEPVSAVAAKVVASLASTLASREIKKWLSSREKRKAFEKALEAALVSVAEAGFSTKGPGALDVSFLTSEGVRKELWAKLLDQTVDEEIDYKRLEEELRNIYPKVEIGQKEIEAIEFFVDALMDKMWYEDSLRDLLTTKILRPCDPRLSQFQKKALIRDYLRAEGEMIQKQLQEDLGEGNRYVEPLIEKKEEKKRQRVEPHEETKSFVPIDMNTYFTEGSDRKVVVVADSGYGKTTVLRELFLRISRTFKDKTSESISPIPIYLTPSQAAGCSESNIVDIVTIRLTASRCREGKVRQFVQDESGKGGFIFLIDALDQVSYRETLRGALEGRAFGSNRVVVTTRPNVWEMEKGHFRDYVELRIREFDESRWQEYLGADRLDDLREIVDKEFLSVPILLRLIAEYWLERDKQTEPVRNRADLYTKVFDRLLKRQEDLDSAKAETQKKRKLAYIRTDLRLLAHDTLAMGYLGQFPRHDAVEILSEDELDDLEARRWILETTETGDEIGFRHRSFQEYLAAEYLKSTIGTEEDLDNLKPYVYHPNWEESTKFLVSLLSVELAEYLVDRVLRWSKGRPLSLYRDHLRLASLCMKEMGEDAGDIQRDMITEQSAKDLENLPLRDTAISLLSTLGDRKAIDLLASLLRHPDSDVRRSAAYALGGIKSEKAAGALIKALQDPEADVRRSAADALGGIKSEKAVGALIKALQDPDADVQESAADSLGGIKSEKAAGVLLKALQDPDAFVRRSAAYALGGIKSEKAVGTLIKALQDPEADVRESAADSLGGIKSEKAAGALIKALQDPDSDVRRSAAYALGGIKSEKAAGALIKALQDPDADVRRSAAYALGGIKSEKAAGALIKALQDPDADVRESAVSALGGIKSEKAAGALIKALQDPEADVRESAAYALGGIKSEKAVGALIKALQDPDADVQESAVLALGRIKSEKAAGALIKALQDPDSDVRRIAASALGGIKSEKAVGALIKALQDPDADVRESAALALGGIKSEKAAGALIKALQDPDADVRESAVSALGGIKSEKAVGALIKALQDPEADVRESAADSLGEIKSEKAAGALIKALQDPEADVRESAALTLGEIKSEKAAGALIKALQDPDADVRGQAADALGALGSPKVLEKLINSWSQEDPKVDRSLLLDAIKSCDRNVRSKQPIETGGAK